MEARCDRRPRRTCHFKKMGTNVEQTITNEHRWRAECVCSRAPLCGGRLIVPCMWNTISLACHRAVNAHRIERQAQACIGINKCRAAISDRNQAPNNSTKTKQIILTRATGPAQFRVFLKHGDLILSRSSTAIVDRTCHISKKTKQIAEVLLLPAALMPAALLVVALLLASSFVLLCVWWRLAPHARSPTAHVTFEKT
jgi:hypothetical protein